jgi:glycosyltransferase 2 family protein
MATLISPRLLRRSLELFAVISALGFIGLLLYGNNLSLFVEAMLSLQWGWVLLGVALASLDWVGGGVRLWVLARHVYRPIAFRTAIVASGMNTWGGYITPTQTGGGPMMIYTLKRYGVPLPEAMISSLMTFVATVVFYAVAGPLALFFGAGRSLERHGILGHTFTLYDLFRLSLGGFVGIGILLIFLFLFPEVGRRLARGFVGWAERRGSARLVAWAQGAREGIDRSHDCMLAFFRGKGWLALAVAVIASVPTFGNRLAAGYVVLRMLGIHAQFVDVILLQTLITFLLYFAPTPGGSGLAEVLSVAVMSIYVPRVLTPSYILLWRVVTCYLTVGVGSLVFWQWLKGAEERAETGVPTAV